MNPFVDYHHKTLYTDILMYTNDSLKVLLYVQAASVKRITAPLEAEH